MEFEITLTAKTTDAGGLKGSFDAQLAELLNDGGTSELLNEVQPYRVDSSDGHYFQAERTYKITL